MNVALIEMDKDKAKAVLQQYKGVLAKNRDETYHALYRGHKFLAKGMSLIDVGEAIKHAGLDHQLRPRLAICRADAEKVCWRTEANGGGEFRMNDRWSHGVRRMVRMPAGTFPRPTDSWKDWEAQVPLIPPPLKPKARLSNYHILWEAEWSPEPARDPILLRRLQGLLFVVLAQWDLSPLERAILRGALRSS